MATDEMPEPTKVDEQGRTIIPADIRKALGIHGKRGYVVFQQEGDRVVLHRVEWVIKKD